MKQRALCIIRMLIFEVKFEKKRCTINQYIQYMVLQMFALIVGLNDNKVH